MTKFPDCMPDSGERVPADPADMIRDVFLLNGGRISKEKTNNMIGRHTFTYGHKITQAWSELLADGLWIEDGDDYVNLIQENYA